MIYELIDDLQQAIENMPQGHGRIDTLRDMLEIVRQNAPALRRHPSSIVQHMANQPDSVAAAASAQEWLAERKQPWIKWTNKFQQLSACMATVGFDSEIEACDVSPYSGRLAVATQTAIHLLDSDLRELVRISHPSPCRVGSCRWLCDDRHLAVTFMHPQGKSADDCRLQILDSEGGSVFDEASGIARISAAHTKPLLVAIADRHVSCWSVAGGLNKLSETELTNSGRLSACWMSVDGSCLVTGCLAGKVSVFNVKPTLQLVKTYQAPGGHMRDSINCCGLSPTGRYVYAGIYYAALVLWDRQEPEDAPPKLFMHDNGVTTCSWLPQDRGFVSTSIDGMVYAMASAELFNADYLLMRQIMNLPGSENPPFLEPGPCRRHGPGKNPVIFSGLMPRDTSPTFVTAGAIKTVKKWDLDRWSQSEKRKGSNRELPSVMDMAYCAHSDRLLVGSRDGSVRVVHLSEDAIESEYTPAWGAQKPGYMFMWEAVTECAISRDGERMLVGFQGGRAVATDSKLNHIVTINEQAEHQFFELSDSFKKLFPDRHPEAMRKQVGGVHFGPDDRSMLVVWMDAMAKQFDEEGNELTHTDLPHVADSNVSPTSGRIALAFFDGRVELRDWDTPGHADHVDDMGITVACLEFAPNGSWFCGGAYDGTVKVWSTDTKEQLHCLKFDQRVKTIAVSRDGRYLAIGLGWGAKWNTDPTGSVYLVDLTTERPVAVFPTDVLVNRIYFVDDHLSMVAAVGTHLLKLEGIVPEH